MNQASSWNAWDVLRLQSAKIDIDGSYDVACWSFSWRIWTWGYEFNSNNMMWIPRETETTEKAGTSEKTCFYPKTQFFWISQFSSSALSYKVLPLMFKNQQCNYQHAASVLCCAWLETLLGNYGKLFLHISNACRTTFLWRKCSDKQCQFLHTSSIHNNLNCVFAKNISRWASDPFSHEICPRKDHQWA